MWRWEQLGPTSWRAEWNGFRAEVRLQSSGQRWAEWRLKHPGRQEWSHEGQVVVDEHVNPNNAIAACGAIVETVARILISEGVNARNEQHRLGSSIRSSNR